MPRDAALGRELASKLTAAYVGKIKEIEFTYDIYVELDGLKNEPYVFISPQAAPMLREGRDVLIHGAELLVTFISVNGPKDDPSWIDAQLESYDMMLELIYRTEIGAKKLIPVTITYDERYDTEKFQTHARLVCEAVATYNNL